jgi:hypothetical protein
MLHVVLCEIGFCHHQLQGNWMMDLWSCGLDLKRSEFYGSNATSHFCAAIFHIHTVVRTEFLNHIYNSWNYQTVRGSDCSKHHDTRSRVFLKSKKKQAWAGAAVQLVKNQKLRRNICKPQAAAMNLNASAYNLSPRLNSAESIQFQRA